MASNNGSVGKWEVVRKGKKNNPVGAKTPADKKSGSGGRKALGESNQPSRRECSGPVPGRLSSLTNSDETTEPVGLRRNQMDSLPLGVRGGVTCFDKLAS